MVSENNTRIQVKFSKEMYDKIFKRAEKEKRTMSNLISFIVEKEMKK